MEQTLAKIQANPVLSRFFSKVEVTVDGCWTYQGRPDTHGYARIAIERRYRIAHRVVYEALVGTIPNGLHLDHLCRNRRCVRPEHLEPVTARVNVLRGVSFSAINAQKTECHRGHRLDESNVRVRRNGARRCKQCARIAEVAYRARIAAREATP